MKSSLAGIVALVLAGTIAVSCGTSSSHDSGQPGSDASCGGPGQACCNGAACDNGLTCRSGTCSGSGAGDASATDASVGSSGDVAIADEPEGPPSSEAGGDSSDDGAAGSAVPCKSGDYKGPFSGNYTSPLTGIGLPIPVMGNVDLTLDQVGSAGATCMLGGEATPCSNLLNVQDGTITGRADAILDASAGGFPYSCTMSGTLDCESKRLVNGWIQCVFCLGPPVDGGTGCGQSGGAGSFAGPLTASYDSKSLSFVMGTWNGAEALTGNDGGSPGPDGGPISNYLSDSGNYFGPGDFGGSGVWSATRQ